MTKEECLAFWAAGSAAGECFEYPHLNSSGYGQFERRGIIFLAHRLAYLIEHQKVPAAGRVVRHTCDNRACYRPLHLVEGTHAQNSADRVSRNRQAKGEAVAQSRLTDADVLAIRADYSQGGTTHRELAKRYGVTYSGIGQVVRRETWAHL